MSCWRPLTIASSSPNNIDEINTIYEDYKKDLAAVFDMDSTDNRKVCRSVRQKVIFTIRACFVAMEDLNHSASVRTKDALFDIIDAMIALDDDDINAAFYVTQDLHTALDTLVETPVKLPSCRSWKTTK